MKLPNLTFIFDRKKRSNNANTGSIELCVYCDKKRKYLTTGIKVYPREWKKSKGEVVNRQDMCELNEQLHLFRKKCNEIVIRMIQEERLDLDALPSVMKQEMTLTGTFLSYARERAKLHYGKIADGTKKHYDLFFKFMEKWKGIVYFTDVTETNVLKLDEELRGRGLKSVSRWSYHKMLKMFILHAMEDGLVKKNPYARLDIKRKESDALKRVLTPEEFHRFEKCEIDLESLCRVRDLFVFQTYTMMSYQDMEKFEWKKCEKTDGGYVYKAKRLKTGQEFVVVLLKPALDILKKYKNRLPMISNVKYNLYLKSAVKYAKIDKPVSTHWARHTGATLLLNEGKIPMHIVQHILGHSSIRETEKTYAKVMDKTIVDAMLGME